MKAILLVLTNPGSPATETQYNQWYTNEHIPDVLAVPGYTQATRWRCYDSWSPFEQKYFATYELEVADEAELRSVSDEHMRRIAAGDMRAAPSGAMDRDAMRAMYYVAVEPEQHSSVNPKQQANSIFVTYNQPRTPDVADEYNRWYRDVHLPDVLSCPGFISAQRFAMSGINMLGRPWITDLTYVNIYQHSATNIDDYNAAFAVVRERIMSGDIVMTDTLTPDAPTAVYGRISDPQFAKS
jgi:hypothetical protein